MIASVEPMVFLFHTFVSVLCLYNCTLYLYVGQHEKPNVCQINDPDPEVAASSIEDIALTFLWVGLGMLLGGYLRTYGLMTSAKRMTHKFRIAYLRQTLRQVCILCVHSSRFGCQH